MKLEKNGQIYELPPLSRIKSLGFSIRNKDEARAFSHGVIETGDDMVDKRQIDLEMMLVGISQADHDQQLDELLKNLYRNDQRLFVRDDRYLKLKTLTKVQHEYITGYNSVRSKITATFKAADPFFYDLTDNTFQYACTDITPPTFIASYQITEETHTPYTFVVTNYGTADTLPTITINATANCPDITLTNLTDNNRSFRYADVQLVAGQSVVIDCQQGTVYRNGMNGLNSFAGSFLRLLPGDNQITYSGGNCTITIAYPKRWL